MSENLLRAEHALAQYHSPMSEENANESWLALRREMLRARWAKEHGIAADEVGIVFNPKTGKAFFQWKGAIRFLPIAESKVT